MARQLTPITPLPGESAMEALLGVIGDPKRLAEYRKHIDDMKTERDRLNTAIGDWNKKKTSESLVAEAKSVHDKAVGDAKKLIEETKAEAEAEKKRSSDARKALKKREEDCVAREAKLSDALAAAESELKARKKDLSDASSRLDAKASAVEARARRVEELLVEYLGLTNKARAALGLPEVSVDDLPKVPAETRREQ